SIPLAVGICVCAERLIGWLDGPAFLEAAVLLRVVIWIVTLSFLSEQFRFFFTALGRQRVFARLVLTVFALKLALELALIPSWDYLGACAGSVAGELFFTAAGLGLCGRLGVGGVEWRALLGAALGGAVMAVLLWPARSAPAPLLLAAV